MALFPLTQNTGDTLGAKQNKSTSEILPMKLCMEVTVYYSGGAVGERYRVPMTSVCVWWERRGGWRRPAHTGTIVAAAAAAAVVVVVVVAVIAHFPRDELQLCLSPGSFLFAIFTTPGKVTDGLVKREVGNSSLLFFPPLHLKQSSLSGIWLCDFLCGLLLP